jgi:excisionase family DNA binding protein
MEQKKNPSVDQSIRPLLKLILDTQLEILGHLLMQNLWHDMSEARILKQKKKNNKETEYYTNEEVMELLNISRRTLQTLRSEGRIGYVKAHKTIRYSKDDIDVLREAKGKE